MRAIFLILSLFSLLNKIQAEEIENEECKAKSEIVEEEQACQSTADTKPAEKTDPPTEKQLEEKASTPSEEKKKTAKKTDNSGQKKENEKPEKKKEKEEEAPWFAGTYLAQYAVNIEPCHLLVTPSFEISQIPGYYNEHSDLIHDRNLHLYTWILMLETGLTKKIDITLDLTGIYAHLNNRNAYHQGDTQVFLGFQVALEKKESWVPDLRVLLGGGFPTGKYDRLNPEFNLSDVTGTGAYEVWLIFVAQKTFYNRRNHPYKWNINLTTIHPSEVSTKGLSIYGGGPGVSGRAVPGERFIANLSYEYKFDKHWGWGIDLNYDYQNSSSFFTRKGISTFVGLPSFETFSLAPEIEYNFNEDATVEAGVWYSVFGRNTPAFFTGFVSFNFLF
jgi:hypothetical protein